MCKECGKVYSVLDMVDGICPICRDPKLKSKRLKEEKKEFEYLKNLVSSKTIFDKAEIETILGKCSFLGSAELIGEISYLGGIEEIDTLIKDKKIILDTVSLKTHQNGLSIEFHKGFLKSTYLALPYNKITAWTIEVEEELIRKEDKSVIGRALIGGVLFGPVGAIVGGISGTGQKKMPYSPSNNNILTLMCNIKNQDVIILFGIKSKNLQNVFTWFNKNLSQYYKKPTDIEFKKEPSIKIENNIFIADELKELKALVDDGILTQKEFDKQKEKLLNK